MSSPEIVICVASMQPDCPLELQTWVEEANSGFRDLRIHHNTPERNDGVVGSYQKLYEENPRGSILMFLHDDVICREKGWDERVLSEFEDPEVGLVGFGGARGHGAPALYKTPYRVSDLARRDYLSNVDDAEVHGGRFSGSCDVAVLDGYALIVRRSVLDRLGGFQSLASGCDFYCYDYALSAATRRLGFRIRLVGVRCHHLGGRTSVLGGASPITSQEAYDKSHRWFYETYRDVMPCYIDGAH